jgi:DNA-directed RNA polymerase specialized sigma24 family protein
MYRCKHNPSAAHEVRSILDQPAAMAALRGLPERQCEAVVLRYDAGLPEREIAVAIGISTGAVQSHTARGLSALHAALEQADPQPAHPATATTPGARQQLAAG